MALKSWSLRQTRSGRFSGFLYEVATYKELEPWLAEIMSTWKFL